MSKIIGKMMVALCLFSFALFAQADSVVTNLPQIQAVYGGSIKAIDIIEPVGTANIARIFVSTESSANSIFYADVDHTLDPAVKYATNNFRFRVVPDFDAQANFGSVSGIAGHEDSGRLFVANNRGLLSCATNAGTLVTNIVSSGSPGANFLAVNIHGATLLALANLNNAIVLYFGALDASGNFSQGAGSPINVGLNGINNSSDIGLAVNPSNDCVYVIDSAGSHGILKSSAPCTALSGATFSSIALPAEASSWQGNKRLGFGPEGRMFIGGASGSNKAIAYSDNDGASWTVVNTGVGGTVGNNIQTSYQTNLYGVVFGGAISTNKGEAGSWKNIGYNASAFSTHANDSAAFYDPILDRRAFYCSSDQGIACSTNGGANIFEIDYGLEAVAIQDFDMNAAKTLAWTASKSGLRHGAGEPMALTWTPDGTFPLADGSPYYSIAIDKGDTSGNTVYAGNGNIYKTTDGGTNWTRIWTLESNTNGFPNTGHFAALAAYGQNVVAGFYSGSGGTTYGAGGLLISQDGGTNWAQVLSSLDVNDVFINSGTILAAVAYNATSGLGGIYSISASGGLVHELAESAGIRSLAVDSSGGIYACGQSADLALKIYHKSASGSSWTAVATNGLPPQTQLITSGLAMTVGRDSSSNDLPIIVVGNSLYYFVSGSTTWQTSASLTYPEGSVINVIYWDDLMVGTTEGVYSQNLGVQPVTNRRADPAMAVNGNWYLWLSSMGYQMSGPFNFGVSAVPVAADFDADGKADPAMVDGALWYIWFTRTGYQLSGGPWNFGVAGDPVAADFDADGKADPCMVVDSLWYIWFSGAGYQLCGGPWNLGVAGYPVAADFDADGKGDPCMVVGPLWYIWFSGAGYQLCGGPWNFGVDGIPVAGDFDADGKADPCMVVDSLWYIWFSGAGYQLCGGPWNFGVAGYPVAADFDGR